MRPTRLLLACCLALYSAYGGAASSPDHTGRTARHLLHRPPPPAPHHVTVGQMARGGVQQFNHPSPPLSPPPPYPSQWQGKGAANGAESASKQFLHTHDTPVETQSAEELAAAAALLEASTQTDAGEAAGRATVSVASVAAPGQVSAQSVPDATVSAQSNRFNTKSAAWLGHKSPPPPPISGKEARTEEAEEKQVKKQAEEAAKEEFKQKVMSDKEAENAKMSMADSKFKDSHDAIEGQKMTGADAKAIKQAARQQSASASLLSNHHSTGFVSGMVAVTLLVMAVAMLTVWARRRTSVFVKMEEDSAATRTLLSKDEPLPSYGAVVSAPGTAANL